MSIKRHEKARLLNRRFNIENEMGSLAVDRSGMRN